MFRLLMRQLNRSSFCRINPLFKGVVKVCNANFNRGFNNLITKHYLEAESLRHIGMFCSSEIFQNPQNKDVLHGVSSFCGELVALAQVSSLAKVPALNVLIINSSHKGAAATLALKIPPEGFVLVNSDRKSNYLRLPKFNGNLVTYGLNQKACLTTSSITSERLQVCIQRAFPNMAKGVVSVQEFAIHMHSLGVEMSIALAGAMLVCGATMGDIDSVFNH